MEYPNNRSNGHDLVNIRNIPLAMATFNFGYGGNVVYPQIEAGYVGVWSRRDENVGDGEVRVALWSRRDENVGRWGGEGVE